jgi:FkbM family methyltransferase
MLSPATDPGFASSPLHGEAVQARLVKQVLARVKRHGLALDVGAHIGTWTVPLAARFEQVIAFEPVAANRACLEANVAWMKNVIVLPVAVSDHNGTGSMALPGDNSGTYCLLHGTDVLVTTLDVVVHSPVDFIKLDVEGAEGAVLMGAEKILRRSRPAVFFEDNGLGERHYGPSWVDPKSILQRNGYRPVVRLAKNELWLPD